MRQVVNARLVSKKGNKAQVVCYLGEGGQRQSVTRHLQLKNFGWFGNNPNEAAVQFRKGEEARLERMQGGYDRCWGTRDGK